MLDLTFDEVEEVSGAINWTSAGLACIAFGGCFALGGNVPAAAICGLVGVACIIAGS